MIILKNNESISHVWSGQLLYGSEQITVDEFFRKRLLDDAEFLQDLEDGKAVINNGEHDLDATLGLLWLKKQLIHEVVPAMDIASIGENVPSLVLVNGVAYGYEFTVGDKIYTRRHLEGIVAPHVNVVARLVVDNIDADKWVQFRIHILTSTGHQDIVLDDGHETIDFNATEIPTTSLLVFEISKSLPLSLFANSENNIYMCLERISPTGKDSPTNNPVVIQVDFEYEKRTDV